MVLIGGTFQTNDWDTSIDMPTAERMFSRAKTFFPVLNHPQTRILSHNVGLRPAREGGPRLEAQRMDMPAKGGLIPTSTDATVNALVIHAYGFG